MTFPGCYAFEKCDPQDVIYQLDYNQDGVKNQGEYVQMFEDCGWEYLKEFVGYTYFRKPAAQMEKEENIFCDDQSRLDLLKKKDKKILICIISHRFYFMWLQLFDSSAEMTIPWLLCGCALAQPFFVWAPDKIKH